MIFHTYVKLPKGNGKKVGCMVDNNAITYCTMIMAYYGITLVIYGLW